MHHDVVVRDAARVLSEALDTPVECACAPERRLGTGVDLEILADGTTFSTVCRAESTASQIGLAIRALKGHGPYPDDGVPLVAVPYMGEVGRELCRAEGISWVDLSGNAHITAPRLRIRIEGKPNKYLQRGRPTDLFAPRSSRVARALLLSPQRTFTQQELAVETGLNAGDISRLVRRYEDAGFITRDGLRRRRLIRIHDYDLLLSAWHQAYDFGVHAVRRGHLPTRSGIESLERMADRFRHGVIEYAATGLAAAWLLEPFATFRLATVYVRDWPADELLADMGYREEPRGSNVWLVRPKDDGVFIGGDARNGICHVGPLQAYLDLKAQPERAAEAAEEIRRRYLTQGAAHA